MPGESDLSAVAGVLSELTALAIPLAEIAIGKALAIIEAIVEPYAPQPDRNRSKHFNTYVRGVGHLPKSAFVEGEPNAKQIRKLKKAGKVRMDSQNMQKRWKLRTHASATGVEGTLRNTATYSGYVSGHHDEDPKQTDFHAMSGWVSIDDAVEQAMPQVEGFFEDAVDGIIELIKAA
jgi:hypothetical protein